MLGEIFFQIHYLSPVFRRRLRFHLIQLNLISKIYRTTSLSTCYACTKRSTSRGGGGGRFKVGLHPNTRLSAARDSSRRSVFFDVRCDGGIMALSMQNRGQVRPFIFWEQEEPQRSFPEPPPAPLHSLVLWPEKILLLKVIK